VTSKRSEVANTTRVYLEEGKLWTFAVALDWPGWARRAKGEQAAIEALLDFAPRYQRVVGGDFAPGRVEVIRRVAGTMTTDFGAPDARGSWDDEALTNPEATRFIAILEASWRYFDGVVHSAPLELTKGPRGGGRNRDQIADHVREAERALASKLGTKVAPRTAWPEQRAAIIETLQAGAPGGSWPPPYALRRGTWHVLDHAWEIEDKST